jgi:fumarate hydratase class II
VSLIKIANDIRWLGSGPRAGFGELALPEVQPGSSIMPGKVNPVIAEALTMVCAQVMGNNTTITIAGQSSSFELNVMMPVASRSLLESISLLSAATRNFVQRLVVGLKATGKGPEMLERGLAIATALVPTIGYDISAEISKEALKSGRTIREVARERTKLSDEELNRLLNPDFMTEPGLTGAPGAG